MTQGELSTMPISKCILMIRAHNPFFCDKFPIEKHPNFSFLEDFDSKNAYDKSAIKVVTLAEFQAENALKYAKEEPESKTASKVSEKIEKVLKSQETAVSETVIKDGFEYESYAEIEQFADNFDGDEVVEKFYGQVSELEFIDTGEPIKEVSFDEYESELSGGFSLEEYAEEEPYNEDYPQYSDVFEDIDVEEIDEEFAENVEAAVNPNAEKTYPQALDIRAFIDPTDYFM